MFRLVGGFFPTESMAKKKLKDVKDLCREPKIVQEETSWTLVLCECKDMETAREAERYFYSKKIDNGIQNMSKRES